MKPTVKELKSLKFDIAKAQMQEDILTILEGFGIDEAMEGTDYNNLVTALCDVVVKGLNQLK
jgi:hypothetical protein